jgi:hypothetical protein
LMASHLLVHRSFAHNCCFTTRWYRGGRRRRPLEDPRSWNADIARPGGKDIRTSDKGNGAELPRVEKRRVSFSLENQSEMFAMREQLVVGEKAVAWPQGSDKATSRYPSDTPSDTPSDISACSRS